MEKKTILDYLRTMDLQLFEKVCSMVLKKRKFTITKKIWLDGLLNITAIRQDKQHQEKSYFIFIQNKKVTVDELKLLYEESALKKVGLEIYSTEKFDNETVEFIKEHTLPVHEDTEFATVIEEYDILRILEHTEPIMVETSKKESKEKTYLPSAGLIDEKIEWATELYENKNYKKALKYVEEALRYQPSYEPAWLLKGKIFMKLGDYNEAKKCFERAISENPDSTKPYFALAELYFSLNQFDKEIECYDKILSVKKRSKEAWNNKGIALINLNDLDEALLCFNKSLKISPKFVSAWNNKGVVFKKLGKTEEAIESFKHVIELDRSFLDGYSNLISLLIDLKRFDEAKKYITELISQSENNELAYFFDGVVAFHTGSMENSIKALQKALSLNSNFEEAKKLLEEIKKTVDSKQLDSKQLDSKQQILHSREKPVPIEPIPEPPQPIELPKPLEIPKPSEPKITEKENIEIATPKVTVKDDIPRKDAHTLKDLLSVLGIGKEDKTIKETPQNAPIQTTPATKPEPIQITKATEEPPTEKSIKESEQTWESLLKPVEPEEKTKDKIEIIDIREAPLRELRNITDNLLILSDYSKAQKHLERLIQGYPKKIELRKDLVLAKILTGQYKDAEHRLEKDLKDFNWNVTISLQIAALKEILKEYEPALENYLESINKGSVYSNQNLRIALLYMRLKNWGEALKYVDKALVYDKDNPLIWTVRGVLLYALDKNVESSLNFNRALQIDPTFGPAKVNLARLMKNQK